jgi:hypothetical protein
MLKKIFIIAFFALAGLLYFVRERYGDPIVLSAEIPIAFQNKTVSDVFITYRFTSTIQGIETDIRELSLVSPNDNLPVFKLGSAKIFRPAGEKFEETAISDLQKDMRVTVEAFYDVKNSTWTTAAVYISPSQGPAGSN